MSIYVKVALEYLDCVEKAYTEPIRRKTANGNYWFLLFQFT